MRSIATRRASSSGFTLIELLVVIAIMALLAALTMFGMRYATVMSKRQTTTAFHRAIQSGLENYNSENGEFPITKNINQTNSFGTYQYNTGSAQMLYQALSGDGSDQIRLGSAGGAASNGIFEDAELNRVMLKEMPPNMVNRISNTAYCLVDAFAHPFQYVRVDYGNGTSRPNPTTGGTSSSAEVPTINPTYDLWSYGEDETQRPTNDISTRLNPARAAKWIKNW
jgi:prepilin-type N-terminal cleavage/methylation domain-containing protein